MFLQLHTSSTMYIKYPDAKVLLVIALLACSASSETTSKMTAEGVEPGTLASAIDSRIANKRYLRSDTIAGATGETAALTEAAPIPVSVDLESWGMLRFIIGTKSLQTI